MILGEKSLATPRSQTCAGGLPVQCSNQLSYIPTPTLTQSPEVGTNATRWISSVQSLDWMGYPRDKRDDSAEILFQPFLQEAFVSILALARMSTLLCCPSSISSTNYWVNHLKPKITSLPLCQAGHNFAWTMMTISLILSNFSTIKEESEWLSSAMQSHQFNCRNEAEFGILMNLSSLFLCKCNSSHWALYLFAA